MTWNPNSKYIVSGSSDHTVRIWEASSGELLRTLEGHTDMVNSVAWSPDGKYIASSSDDGTVKIWDASSGEEVFKVQLSGSVTLNSWYRDILVAGCGSGDIILIFPFD